MRGSNAWRYLIMRLFKSIDWNWTEWTRKTLDDWNVVGFRSTIIFSLELESCLLLDAHKKLPRFVNTERCAVGCIIIATDTRLELVQCGKRKPENEWKKKTKCIKTNERRRPVNKSNGPPREKWERKRRRSLYLPLWSPFFRQMVLVTFFGDGCSLSQTGLLDNNRNGCFCSETPTVETPTHSGVGCRTMEHSTGRVTTIVNSSIICTKHLYRRLQKTHDSVSIFSDEVTRLSHLSSSQAMLM